MAGSKTTKTNNLILIPTDFSPVCENAILHGIGLAQFLDYGISILHVVDKTTRSDGKTGHNGPESIRKRLQKYKDKYDNHLPGRIKVMSRNGNVIQIINNVAKELNVRLTILGTHGKQGLQHFFGSHALKVVLDSPCPVIVVQNRSFGKGYQKIVLPVSSEIEPQQALEWILHLNHLFGSKILICQSREADNSINNRLNKNTRQICKTFDEHKIPFEIRTAGSSSDFSAQVIEQAVASMTDLIVIMTMPSQDTAGFSLSEWNERIMFDDAGIPVMCINPAEQESNS
jgi:nucleotide-binding universal stress UspA family protein